MATWRMYIKVALAEAPDSSMHLSVSHQISSLAKKASRHQERSNRNVPSSSRRQCLVLCQLLALESAHHFRNDGHVLCRAFWTCCGLSCPLSSWRSCVACRSRRLCRCQSARTPSMPSALTLPPTTDMPASVGVYSTRRLAGPVPLFAACTAFLKLHVRRNGSS